MSSSLARRAGIALVAALALVVSCSDGPTVVAPIAVASVVVSPPTHSLILGQQVTLQARPLAQNGDELEREVVWSSENETLATVSATGVVTTLAVGDVVIRATSENRFGRSVLTIAPVPPVPVAEVRLSVDDEVVLAWDGRTQLSAVALDADGNVLTGRENVTWSSNHPSVVAVWGDGNIEAVGQGIATITATIEGVSSQVGARVLQAPVTAVAITGPTGLEVFEFAGFGAAVTRANGQTFYEPVSWTSSAPSVAEVTHVDIWSTVVAAKAVGEVTLTATKDGISDSRTMYVTPRTTHDLVYNRWTNGASEIFMLGIAIDGYPPVKLNAGNVSREPSASPDGLQVVFAVSQLTTLNEWQHDLYIVNRNGTNMRWLTRADGVEERPRWSPDGTKILFRGDVGGGARADLYTIKPDGSEQMKITGAISNMTDIREASWSADGTRIVFIGVVGGQHKVWTIRADGTDLKQVTTDVGFDQSPTYSPDGTKIAFVRYNTVTPANGNDIMIVSASGGEPVRLALAGDQLTPAWSPDGYYIAIAGTPVAGQGQLGIYTLRPDGTGLRLRTIDPAWGGGTYPTWIARP